MGASVERTLENGITDPILGGKSMYFCAFFTNWSEIGAKPDYFCLVKWFKHLAGLYDAISCHFLTAAYFCTLWLAFDICSHNSEWSVASKSTVLAFKISDNREKKHKHSLKTTLKYERYGYISHFDLVRALNEQNKEQKSKKSYIFDKNTYFSGEIQRNDLLYFWSPVL